MGTVNGGRDGDLVVSAVASSVPRIGLLGCGTVGAAVVRGVQEQALGRITHVAVRDVNRTRDCDLLGVAVHRSPLAAATAPDVDVVVEALGGTDVAFQAVRAALELGRCVVTANKALIATHGPALDATARRTGATLRFEAAVAGAVPAVATVAELARTDRIGRIDGILNGTTNHVLCDLADGAVSVADAVVRAQQLGFAEADPTRDLDGTDAADKLAILARVAWGHEFAWARTVSTADVVREGIERLDARRVAAAARRGEVWRLVASATADGELRVQPWSLPRSHPFANVFGPDNAVAIEARRAGRLTLTGPGAGGDATASAILRDLTALQRPDRPVTALRPVAVG